MNLLWRLTSGTAVAIKMFRCMALLRLHSLINFVVESWIITMIMTLIPSLKVDVLFVFTVFVAIYIILKKPFPPWPEKIEHSFLRWFVCVLLRKSTMNDDLGSRSVRSA